MREKEDLIHRICLCIGMIGVGTVVMGTKACQENYYLAAQVTGVGTGTPDTVSTATPTGSPSITGSGTPTATPVVVGVESPTPTVEPTLDTAPARIQGKFSFNSDLSDSDSTAQSDSQTTSASGNAQQSLSNWLGQAFRSGANVDDSDGDGFSDDLESRLGSNPHDRQSVPKISVKALLAQRIHAEDPDMDGLTSEQEAFLGTSSTEADTDQDGCPDGSEKLSETDPLTSKSSPDDSDGDCLSDQYENAHHLDPEEEDTDSDGLEDIEEIAIGANPLDADTDGDGILDGKEVELGMDPTVPDPQ